MSPMSQDSSPQKRILKRRILGIAIAASIVVLDSLSKVMVKAIIATGGPLTVTPFLNIILVQNEGIAFGILAETALSPFMMAGVSFIIGGAFMTVALFEQTLMRSFSLAAIGGGGIANGLDRLLHGAVIDFLDVHIANLHFYAFNCADSAITLGVILYLLSPPPKISLPYQAK